MREQRPDPPRIFVGQGHHIWVSSMEQLSEPVSRMIRWALGDVDDRARAVNEQRPQIGIAALANAQQRGLAAAGMLLGNQSQPGRQLPAIFELSSIAEGGHQGARRERADTRDRGQLAAGGLFSMPSLDLFIQFLHLSIQGFNSISNGVIQIDFAN